MVSVLASETVGPNEARTAAIPALVSARLFLDLEAMPASSAYSIPQIGCGSATVSWGLSRPFSGVSGFVPPAPSHSSLTLVLTIPFTTSVVALNRSAATRSTALKNALKNNGASTHPCRRPCPTPNLSEYSPSSVRMRALTHSIVERWRVTATVFGGSPNRASTALKRIRSTIEWIVGLGVVDETHVKEGCSSLVPIGEVVGPRRSHQSSTVAV